MLVVAECYVANSPSSLDPRLASRTFAVAQDQGRDLEKDARLISVNEALGVHTCLSARDSDASRVTKQVIGPRLLRSWLDYAFLFLDGPFNSTCTRPVHRATVNFELQFVSTF